MAKGFPGTKRCLDPVRMETIKTTVLGYVDGDADVKKLQWNKCIDGMSKKMSEMKKVVKKVKTKSYLSETIFIELIY